MYNQEIWKELPKDLNLSKYIVSSFGKIKHIKKNKCLSQNLSKYTGYIRSSLTLDNGKHKNFTIHRLIAITFLENINNLPVVDHINNIKHDNRIQNLRWASFKDNALNRIGKNTSFKKQIEQIENNIIINSWESIKLAIDTLGFPSIAMYVDKHQISNIITSGTIRNGYLVTTVCKKPYYIHRLVASAFNNIKLDNIEVVDHLDNNRQNNKIENLNITTNLKNLQKSLNKIVELFDNDNTYIRTYESLTKLCKDLNFSSSVISNAIKNKKKFNGYYFRYK